MTGVRRAALLAALASLLVLLAGPGVADAAVTATDSQFTYSGTWNTVTGTNHEHWTAQVGATAKVNFVTSVAGQTVTLKGVRGATSGNHTANVVIDASAPAVANEATGTGQTQNATVWTSGAIGVGNHTLTLTVTQAEFSVENLTLTAGSFGGPGYTPPPPAACGDGLDNDSDGLIDYPADPGCTSTSDTDETNTTSGTGLPVGDLPGWHQTYAQDFTTAATPAQFAATYPRMFPYADNASYAQSNISVGGGSLNINERADGVGAAVVVRAGSDTGWGQTYGRYSVRFRADAANNFGSAFLLWPDSNVWGDGETDYPEGNFADQIHVYEHCLGANAPSNCLTVNTGASWQAWHVATTEWSPTSVKFFLDGALIGTDTSAVSTASRHWVMQTAGNAGSQTGSLQIDWVALYARVG